MDQLDIMINLTLPLGSAVWDSNGTVHWAVGERAVLNDRGSMMTWAACATPQPVLPPHNPGYLDAPLNQVVVVSGQAGTPKPKPNCPECLVLYPVPHVCAGRCFDPDNPCEIGQAMAGRDVMGITERNAKKDTIDKYLRFHWGNYPHVFTGALEGKTQREGAEMFTNQIVKLAQEDGIELKPADVARRAADHPAGQDRTGVHWRIMDDYGRDLEQEDAQPPPFKGDDASQ